METDVLQLDIALTHAINSLAGQFAPLDWIMLFLAKIVVFLMVLAVAVRWFWPSNRPHERHVAVSCGLAAALALGANQVILLFYDRLRPYETGVSHPLLPPNSDPSFPSDHSTLAFAIAATLLLQRHPLAKLFGILAALVALSRVYVGVHYSGDVLGGAVIGSLFAWIVSRLYREGNALDRRLVKIL